MSGLTPPNPLSYVGQVVVPFIKKDFPPQSTFNEFNVPTIWIDYESKMAYMLTGKPQGVAEWINLGGTPGTLDTITTPDLVTVVPDAGDINFANGTGMNITGSGSTVTFNSTGGGLAWSTVSGATQAMVIHNGYITDRSGTPVAFSLPATAALGSVIKIAGLNTGGWSITQAAGQQVILGNLSSTIGVGGSIASTLQSDTIELVCVVANTTFKALSWTGNLTVV